MRHAIRVGQGILLAALLWTVPAPAQVGGGASPAEAVARAVSWENPGGNVPVDPAWRFGTLPNGVRFAVRRGIQPPGTIAVRVRMGVGALMEADGQRGWTHLLEHMVFRGTKNFADGEGIKLWQRLGATFGRDTNASTTATATTFQLDLPRADLAGYNQGLTVLAEMMDTARIDPALLATEKQVVDAERAQRISPLTAKLRNAQQPLLFAGTKAGKRDVIGTAASLALATPNALRAYYEAWYRPDNAVVVAVGDADPQLLEDGIRRAFGSWKAEGPRPADPDWGAPVEPPAPVVAISDPQTPETALIAFVSAHPEQPYTIARQQQQLAEFVATGILQQRMAAAVRRGGPLLQGGVQRAEQRHVADQLLVQLQAKPGQWQAALNEVYAILNEATSAAPQQVEIDQQTANIAALFAQRVSGATTQSSPGLATALITDVDQGDVTAAPEFYVRLFAAQRPTLTPAAVQSVMKRLLAPAPRLLIATPAPLAGGQAAAIAALAGARNIAAAHSGPLRTLSLDQLKLRGRPARVTTIAPIPALGAERIRFSNGTELVFKRTSFERNRVHVLVQIGGGLLAEPRNAPGLWWTAGGLASNGIGPFAPDELPRATAGRQIGFTVGAGLQALALTGTSNPADFGDMLKLMTGEITQPRFDPIAVARLRATVTANYASLFSQPMSVLGALAGPPLHGGDRRFENLPSTEAIGQLTPEAFRHFWTARLSRGPIRVVVVGDVDRDAVTAAVGRTLGTMPPRTARAVAAPDLIARRPAVPVILGHRGNPDQAVAIHVFPTIGALEDPATSAALDLAAGIVQTRLTEGFRETEGGSYTPIAAHSQSTALPRYGVLIAGAQVQSARLGALDRSLNAILADLADKGPSADSFARVLATAISATERSRTSNGWWLGALSGELSRRRVAAITGYETTLKSLTPASVRQAAARFLTPARSFTIQVLPPVTVAKPSG